MFIYIIDIIYKLSSNKTILIIERRAYILMSSTGPFKRQPPPQTTNIQKSKFIEKELPLVRTSCIQQYLMI